MPNQLGLYDMSGNVYEFCWGWFADDYYPTCEGLGSATLAITPFLARYFELRNGELLAVSMGLQEYSYIYSIAYRDQLLSPRVRNEIFSDGEALSPEASAMLQDCLSRQLQAAPQSEREALESELQKMADDPHRLPRQDGLPDAVLAGVARYREQLDLVFCGATAGLEMEQNARRALRVALE